MKLNNASDLQLEEAKVYIYKCIAETQSAPRWQFHYPNFRTDPTPDILVLGGYTHPSTKNDLVGGINLHYLNSQQQERLAKVLPSILQAKNLYERYWIGRRVYPEVFKKFYRTYRADFINGLSRSSLKPKVGIVRRAVDWLRDRVKGPQPEFPDDLSGLQQKLDRRIDQIKPEPEKEVQQIPSQEPPATQKPPVEPPVEKPAERSYLDAARAAFARLRGQKAINVPRKPEAKSLPIEQPIKEPSQLLKQAIPQPDSPEIETPEAAIQEPDYDKAKLQDERERNKQELENPENDIELEYISYYSPRLGKVIVESIDYDRRVSRRIRRVKAKV